MGTATVMIGEVRLIMGTKEICKMIILLIVGCMFVGFGLPAKAEEDSVEVQISLVSRATITQGEPILLHYTISNVTNHTIAVGLGLYNTDWYQLSLVGHGGANAAPLPDERPMNPQGAFATPRNLIDAGGNLSGYIVATRFLAISHSGSYTLGIHLHLPYLSTEDDRIVPQDKTIRASGTSIEQIFNFPIVVLPPDTVQLLKTATLLRQQYSQRKNEDRSMALLDALFSMPEAQASPIWESLANDPKESADLIASKLRHVNTITAADILAGMLQKRDRNQDELAAVSRNLNEMYNTANPPLKAHLRQIATSYGITLPEKITIPQAGD